MSKKFAICSATYNIALNQDANDVFGTGCAHLYHFLQGNGNRDRSAEHKPMVLKMHLELNELIEETEEQVVEPSTSNNPERQFTQQLEAKFQSLENSSQAKDDVVNKLIKLMEQHEQNLSNIVGNKLADVGNNTIDHESNNVLLSISDNFPRQSDRQLEEKLKTLEDALQVKDDAAHKIIERMEKLEKNLSNVIVNKLADVGSNTIDHESINALLNSSEKSARQSSQLEKEIKALKDCIEKLVNNKAGKETADIGNPTTHDNSTEKQQQQANSSQKPSNNGNNGSDDHSVDKEYQTTPKENQEIQFDRDNLVLIGLIKSSDSSLVTAIHNVIKYAKEMKLSLTPDQIEHMDVRIIDQDILIYYVFFRTRTTKEAFLMKSNILERFPHNLGILNESEFNRVYIRNFKSSDLKEDSAIVDVIGLAKQMGLTLMRDQIKAITVFRVNPACLVCCVSFYTTQMENEFLNKSHILKKLPATKSFEIY